MARPIWKGNIAFGLVNIPVTLHSAETTFDLHFHLIDSRNKARVHYERINESTGEEVPWDKIVKGYEFSKNNYVLLNDEDFKRADVEASQTIEIEDFVPRDQLEFIYFQKPYYLLPQKKSEKGYVLLREVLKETGKIGIAKIVIRTRQHIAAVIPCCNALIINLLRYKQEIKHPSELDIPTAGAKISPREMEVAKQLVASATTDWKPEKYHDEYRAHLMKWIQKKAKAHGKEIPDQNPPETTATETGVDILELLKKSIKDSHNGHKAPAHSR